jgi:hypothetical protein
MHRLMIKTHSITGLNYLCVTTRKNWEEYPGSGVYWNKHLKKHGSFFTTELIYETEDFLEFCKVCIDISVTLNIVLSEEFANLIPEDGGSGRENFKLFWDYATKERKREIYDQRVKTRKWYSHSEETKKKISLKSIERWDTFTLLERREMTELMRLSSKDFYANKDTIEYLECTQRQSKNMKNFWANMTEDHYREYCKKISDGRLNMPEDTKKLRAIRVGESFKKSSKRKKFVEDMKIKRLGINNPASKPVKWMGEIMPIMEFTKLCKKNKYSKEFIENAFLLRDDCEYLFDQTPKKYPAVTCPHCGQTSDENKKPSSFKRWHFDNCKGKKT